MAEQHKSKKKHKASKALVEYFKPERIEEFPRRRLIAEGFRVDQSVFKKSKDEKLKLKIEKAKIRDANY
jgi:hypothetical protein